MLRERSRAMRTLRLRIFSSRVPAFSWGRARAMTRQMQASSSSENEIHRTTGLRRLMRIVRKRSAAKACHCERRRRAITTASTARMSGSASAKSHAGWARFKSDQGAGDGLKASRAAQTRAAMSDGIMNQWNSSRSSMIVRLRASVFSSWLMVVNVSRRDFRFCAQ